MRRIHLMNKDSRDATIAIDSLKYDKPFEMGIPGKALNFRRYLTATEANLNHNLAELIIAPTGEEKERRDPENIPANVDDELPVRWTGKKMPKASVAVNFAFKRTIQVRHVDGLTYDYLYEMAKELHDESVMVLIGAGQTGKDPLIFQANGMPYRGFLEGRVDGKKYQLLLHLSNMELKKVKAQAKK